MNIKNFKMFEIIKAPYTNISQVMWRLLLAGFVNSIGLIISMYISLNLNSQGFNIIKIGQLLTAYGFLGLIGGYLGGILSNKYSSIQVCKISLFISGSLFFIYPYFKNYYCLMILCSLVGFFTNLFRPAFILSLTNNSEADDLDNQVALRRVAINLGMAFGAFICGFIAEYNHTYIFIFNACCSFIALFLIFKIPNDKKWSTKQETDPSKSKKFTITTVWLLIVLFLVLLVFNQSQCTFPLFLKNEINFNERAISFLFALNGLLIVFFQVPLTNYLKNNFSNQAYLLGAILIALGFGMNVWVHSYGLIVISCIIWTFGEMIFFPSQLANLIRETNTDNKGFIIGVYQVTSSLAQLSSPIIGTFLYSQGSNYLWYFCMLITFFICASIFLTKIDNFRKSI